LLTVNGGRLTVFAFGIMYFHSGRGELQFAHTNNIRSGTGVLALYSPGPSFIMSTGHSSFCPASLNRQRITTPNNNNTVKVYLCRRQTFLIVHFKFFIISWSYECDPSYRQEDKFCEQNHEKTKDQNHKIPKQQKTKIV